MGTIKETWSEKRLETRLPQVVDPSPQLRALRLTFQRWTAANWAKLSKSTFHVAFVGPDDLAYAMMETVASIASTSGGGFEVMFKNGDRAVVDGEWESLMWKTAALCGLDAHGYSERPAPESKEPELPKRETALRTAEERKSAFEGSFSKRGFGDLK